jgi:hypothetical protein
MRPRVSLAGLVAAVLFSWVSLFAAEGTPPSGGPQIESGRLVDRDANYSFAVPAGWIVRDGSTSELVTVVHAASGASLLVARKPETSPPLSFDDVA